MAADSRDTTVELRITGDLLPVEPSAPSHACLVVIAGPRIGLRTILDEAPLDIGRSSRCSLQLDADSVSRKHAKIVWNGSAHELIDLGSTNGTFVNDQRTASKLLDDGDRVQIGKALLKYIGGGNVEAAYHEEFVRLMSYDGLTNIPNKTRFQEALQDAVNRSKADPAAISLVLFDLDHFKQVNDTHGHTAGDVVLRQAALVANDLVEDPRLVARTGGEEFAILCPGEPLDTARRLAESVRAHIEASRFQFEDTVIPVTASFGVAERAAGSTESPDELYARADDRLYAAKSAGRNCVR